MTSVNVTLTTIERHALIEYARIKLRSPRDQARWIIIQELFRLGYLEQEKKADTLATLDVMEHNARQRKDE